MAQARQRIIVISALAATFAAGFAASEAVADQPMMHRALDELRAARADLEHASTDKGGHRAAAIQHVDLAIDEVKAGIGFDRAH